MPTYTLVDIDNKPIVTTLADADRIILVLSDGSVRSITKTNFQQQIGALLKAPVADAVALAALLIADLVDGESRAVIGEGVLYHWDENMTPAEAATYWSVIEPGDKLVTNGYWYRDGSRIPQPVVIAPAASVGLNWQTGKYWTLNNTIGGGITATINNLVHTDSLYYLEITTNGNPLTVANLDEEGSGYNSAEAVQTLQFYKAGNIIFGTWLNSAFVSP